MGMTTSFRRREVSFCAYNLTSSNCVCISDDMLFALSTCFSSAHYDSVSTGFGTTDDGIGVASLLQFVDHLVKNRPRRTAIFNINNGEEDGLNGAQAFVLCFSLDASLQPAYIFQVPQTRLVRHPRYLYQPRRGGCWRVSWRININGS